MGTSAGPSLQGIGRGGDSNLVLEMDAHDAKSYPGEPTTNYAPIDLADWGTEATAVRTAAGYNFQGQPVYKCRTAVGASYQGIDKTITGLRTAASGGTVTMSIWVKNPNPSQYSFYAYIGYDFSSTRILTANSDWQRIQWTVNESSMGNDYVEYRPYTNSAAIYIHMTMPQVEVLKGYATPFVREGNGGTGTYNARPASVNLMIHGNVGTGQSFYDSSPNKYTVTTGGDTTHSTAQSKFSGGSIYFDGTGDYLSVPDSTDWEFGTASFTIDTWVYFTSIAGSGQTIMLNQYNSGTDWIFQLNNAKWSFYSNSAYHDASVGPSVDTWYHFAVVRDTSTANDTIVLYVDGTLVLSYDGDHTITGAGPLEVGSYDGGSYPTIGYMDEVRIINGTALWTSAFTPPTRRNLSAPVVDRSGNDNGGNFNTTDMTDVSTYRVGEVIRPIDSAVWDFDGTDDEINMGHAGGAFKKDGIDRTIAQWVQSPTATSVYVSSLGYRKSADETGGWMIYWRVGYIRIWNNGGSHSPEVIGVSPNNAFAANTVYHVVATWPGTSGQPVKLYINGEYISAADGTTGTSADSTSNELSIGRYGANSSFHYTGKVYNTQIYDTILTAQQVKENFNQQRSRFNI